MKRVTKLKLEHADTLEQAKIEAVKVKDNASKGLGTFGPLSGIGYMTVAKWVGHKDGGVLIGKICGHLNAAHMKAQTSKLNT